MKKLLPLFLLLALTKIAAGQCAPGFTWTQTAQNEITFNNTTPFTPDSTFFYWTFGDNTYSIDQHPVHIFSDSGTFVVCVSVSDSVLDCSATFCDTITVTGVPICNMALNAYTAQQSGCPSCTFGVVSVNTSAGTPPFSYAWSTGATSQYVGGLDSGFYYVLVTDDNGCTAYDSTYVFPSSISPPPTANYNHQHVAANTVNFQEWTIAYTPFVTFTWNFGDTTYAYGPSVSHTYAYPGTFNVCMTVSDSVYGYSDTYCDTVVILPPPPVTCYPYFTVQPQGSNGAWLWVNMQWNWQCTWSWGDSTSDTIPYPVHIYNDTGLYQVCLAIIDTVNQCTDSACGYIYVSPGNTPFTAEASPIPVGIPDPATRGFRVYPNPAKERLTIDAGFPVSGMRMRITDVAGREIYSGILTGNTLSCAFLESGVYLLQIDTAYGRITERFVRE